MVANCMSLLSRFDQLRVVWSNYYDPSDVWSPLMLQKPLLMDPVNPSLRLWRCHTVWQHPPSRGGSATWRTRRTSTLAS